MGEFWHALALAFCLTYTVLLICWILNKWTVEWRLSRDACLQCMFQDLLSTWTYKKLLFGHQIRSHFCCRLKTLQTHKVSKLRRFSFLHGEINWSATRGLGLRWRGSRSHFKIETASRLCFDKSLSLSSNSWSSFKVSFANFLLPPLNGVMTRHTIPLWSWPGMSPLITHTLRLLTCHCQTLHFVEMEVLVSFCQDLRLKCWRRRGRLRELHRCVP